VGKPVAEEKRRIRKTIWRLNRVKTWQLLVVLLLMVFITATFLRLNNIGMVQRRAAVLAADQTGNPETIQSRLYDLQRFSAEHMNANTGEFYLEGQYKRDVERIIKAASDDSNPQGNIHVKADEVCRPQFAVWSQAYVQCFTDELAKYPPSPDPTQNVSLPSTSLYRHNFASPLWSPDFAGWSVMICIVLILMIIVRLVSLGILNLLLKRHYRGI
jgi:hypothetical protein